jgi:hypothetical protein
MMANIVLKDKNGNPVTHEGITQIEAVNAAGGTRKYSELQTINCYLAAYENSQYRVTAKAPSLMFTRGPDGASIMVDASTIENYGYVNANGANLLQIIVTTKTLTVGESYTSDYIRGT